MCKRAIKLQYFYSGAVYCGLSEAQTREEQCRSIDVL